LEFQPLARREVVGQFDGGSITSDAGGLLLREAERLTGIITRFARCFTDYRDPRRIDHTVEELVGQRVYGLALGYEDQNDHDALRHDPLVGVLAGKSDPTGADRRRQRDRGKAGAGKSTLNRLELTPARASVQSRYKKITLDRHAVNDLFADVFIESFRQAPERIVLDLDATDDPLHGAQSGRFYHGYYRNYCYLPLYIFCGEHLLCARLRPSNIDESAGSVRELQRIVGRLRRAWPTVQIVIRADSGFCRERLMAWCEQHGVDYVLGLAKNSRLESELAEPLTQAKQMGEATGQAARVFKDFEYQTRKSWSCPRRVVGKAEHLPQKANPRFVVTSLPAAAWPAQQLYEQEYCARGDMENRIKEQQLWLFADRTSASTLRANQLRLWLSSVAYTLMLALRRLGLEGGELARAQCGTIRTKLLKIGALIRVTVRKVWVSFSQSFPSAALFERVYAHLRRHEPVPLRC